MAKDISTDSPVRGSGFSYDPESGVCYRALDFLGYPSYRVGDDGSVWTCLSADYHLKNRVVTTAWRLLHVSCLLKGHLRVSLHSHQVLVHHLVLLAFVGQRPPGMECCHFPDRNPANNRVDNLRWDTPKANMADSVKHGTRVVGEKHGSAKVSEQQVRQMRAEYEAGLVTKKKIADNYGLQESTVRAILSRSTWKHVS